MEFHRQMLPHAEPTEAERMAVKAMIRFERLLIEAMGWVAKVLNFVTDNASITVVISRARGGTERRR